MQASGAPETFPSFHEEELAGATEAIPRDEHGQFITAATWFVPHVSDVVTAEAIALRNGLDLAAHIECPKIEAELDSLICYR